MKFQFKAFSNQYSKQWRIGLLSLMGLFLALNYQNCGKVNDKSPFEMGEVTQPSVASNTGVWLNPQSSSPSVTTNDLFFTVSGSCNVGTAPKHDIVIQMTSENGGTIFKTLSHVKCEHNRFYGVIDRTCDMEPTPNPFGVTVQYYLSGQLVTYDENGLNPVSSRNAYFDFYPVSIPWAPGTCPGP